MKKLYTILTFIIFSFANVSAKEGVASQIYQCVFQYGRVKYVPIANKKIPIIQNGMPMPHTATLEKKCFIYADNMKQNTMLLNDFSEDFLTKFVKSVVSAYNEKCKNRECKNNFDCKVLINSVSEKIEEYYKIDKANYGRLGDTIEFFQHINQGDKTCGAKIKSLYFNKKKKLYNEKCFNSVAALNDNYIQEVISPVYTKTWSKELKNCISEIKQ